MHKAMVIGSLLSFGLMSLAMATRADAAPAAPDPVPLYPQNYHVLVENDQVRVLDFRLQKGATEQFHSHPANVAVFLGQFTIRFSLPDGKTALRQAHLGDVAFSGPTVHASENIGNTDAHGILVELKTKTPAPQWVTATTLVHGIAGKEDDLQAHLLSLAAAARAEPGCITYDLYQSPIKKYEFMRYEVWSSAAALEAHKQMPYLRASFEKRQREGWKTEIVTWARVPE
jgi:quinol monooxygenase YgiN/quercetin dioxygenase-like cupin family protein